MLNITTNISEDKWFDISNDIISSIEEAAKCAYQKAKYNLAFLDNANSVLLNIELSNDAEIKILNKNYRGKNKATNVLSFPQIDADYKILDNNIPIILGDVIIAFETIVKEASEYNKKIVEYSCHLVIHGVLHLLGFDHIDDEEAKTMEKLESDIMKNLGYNDPYIL